ncbi:MAG TPA: magnesium and cobalt transport protein CorA [Chlorobium sp.]|uniref:Magnesium transport protein CorA n=1 Tax=Chlorobium phaeovibrioides (strain DSM 265 / 1930) TaxID=290318 RepID=A4SFU3_CHLPM|nr:magnesium and cobalt transport protein CorA [Chlorobium sp.]
MKKSKKSIREIRSGGAVKRPMKKSMKDMAGTVGKAPGTLFHTGGQKTGSPVITLFSYDAASVEHRTLKTLEECRPFMGGERVLWLNIDGLHKLKLIEAAGVMFNLHPLTLEDILHTGLRPKIEDFGSYLFVVVKTLELDPESGEVGEEQLSLVIGKGFVLSFREKPGPLFNPVIARLDNPGTNVRQRGADYLSYVLTDSVVDSYFTILEQFESRIEALDEELTDSVARDALPAMYLLKKELIMLRKSVWPLREIINSIGRSRYQVIDDEETRPFFRDIYDNIVLVIETVETYRDIVIGMYDTWLALANNRMNDIMKVLTIIATVFMPLSFIAGVYGMNFHYMPELESPFGYYAVLGVMGSIFVGMILFFRTRKWF